MARISHLVGSTAMAAEGISGSSQQGMDWEFPLLNESSSFDTEIAEVGTAVSDMNSEKMSKELEAKVKVLEEKIESLTKAAKLNYRYVLNFRNRPGGQNGSIQPMSEVDSIKNLGNRQFGGAIPAVTCWMNVYSQSGQMIPVASVRLNSGLFSDQVEGAFQKHRKESGLNVPTEQPESIDAFGDNNQSSSQS